MNPPATIDAADFTFDGLLRDGDLVVCGQTSAEPLTLTRRLAAHCAGPSRPVRIFVGTLFSDTFDEAPASASFLSYGAIGRTVRLAERGLLDILPERYSSLPGLFSSGRLRAGVVLLQAAEAADGTLSFSLSCDYVMQAARNARLVIVELNPWAPWTHGTPWPRDLRVDIRVRAEHPPLEVPRSRIDAVSAAIGRHVAALVPDGATVQTGVGSLPDATLDALRGHRHLGMHSGILGDAGIDLIRCGALDNSRKACDAGVSVVNTLCASADGYRYADRNPGIQVRHSDYTHGAEVLGRQALLHAINGALEIDLGGQANCETLRGRPQGGIGGLLDFTRAARQSPGGRAITVLPATAAQGKVSRIVPRLSGPATLGRSDIDVVVTEHGVADLRGASLAQRARRLIAIAAPQFRDELAAALREQETPL